MATVNRDDVVALLEERPYSSAELADIFKQPLAAVHRELLALGRAGTLKRVGTAQAWAVAGYVAAVGRKPQVDRPACRRAIRHALAGRAAATEELTASTGYSRTVVKNECALMLTAGDLQHHGVGRASRWSLPGYTLPAPSKPVTSGFATSNEAKKPAGAAVTPVDARVSGARGQTAPITVHEQATSSVRRDEGTSKQLLGEGGARLYPKDQIDELLDDEDEDLAGDVNDTPAVDDIDEDLDELEEPAPTPRRARKSKSVSLRQAPVTTTSAEPSWWVGKDREAFTAAAREHEPRLMHSKTALKMTVRTLP